MIEINDLKKEYLTTFGRFVALDSVSLKLPNSGLVALYGENGCGKTTLLNMISTADSRYEGTIRYDEVDIRDFTQQYRSEIISVVFQENFFVPYLNVSENILLFSDDESEENVVEQLQKYRIEEKKYEYSNNLSGGQKQRVSLIRGIIKKSKILLVDEPTSSLNEEMEIEVFKFLKETAKEKLVILVSHNMSLIRQYADMTIYMDKGKVCSVDLFPDYLEIEYGDNFVAIPKTLKSFSIVDTSQIKKKLDDFGEITLRYSNKKDNLLLPDYSVSNLDLHKINRKLSSRLRKKIAFFSLKSSVLNYLFCVFLLVFLSSIVGLFWSFVDFQPDLFIYNTLKNNIEGKVLFCNSEIDIKQNDNSSKNFDYESYEQLWEKYKSSVSLIADFEEVKSLGFSSESIYSDCVQGFVYCKQRDTDLIYGLYPKGKQLLITDYLADGLVLFDTGYNSYEDILVKGISIEGFTCSVSGVVDTDYEKYKEKYEREEFRNSQAFIDYQTAIDKIYSRLYLPLEEVNQGNISAIVLNNGEYLASLQLLDTLDDNNNSEINECYINTFFNSQINVSDFLKTQCGEWKVMGVIDDQQQTNIIYVSRQTLNYYINSLFVEDHNIIISLKSVKEVEFLSKHGMNNYTSLSNYIEQTIDVILLLQKVFVIVLIVLALLLFALCVFTVNRMLNNDLHLIAFMRILGHPFTEFVKIVSIKSVVVYLFSCVTSVALYCGVSRSLNYALSSLFESDIYLFSIRIISIISITIGLLLCFIGSASTVVLRLYKKQISWLLKDKY